jgi:4-diphosphocytidyl-2-C-methyl-D-erythritol kinase
LGTDDLRALPVTEPAAAKLNPFLRVLGLRSDGFHDVETLVQPITLADGVRAAHRDRGFGLAITGERAADIDPGSENLVLQAARALAEATGEQRGARLMVVKRIPVAAGLGGGSADAAATLRALDRLWGWGMGPAGLREIAAGLGSDVPALLEGGPVLAGGRGDRVEPVQLPKTWWVVAPAPFGIASAEAYGWWDQEGGPTGPDPTNLMAALREGDLAAAGPMLFNDLEGPVLRRRPPVAEARQRLLDAGALGAVLCGSGPTVAGLAHDSAHADRVAAEVGGLAVASMAGP